MRQFAILTVLLLVACGSRPSATERGRDAYAEAAQDSGPDSGTGDVSLDAPMEVGDDDDEADGVAPPDAATDGATPDAISPPVGAACTWIGTAPPLNNLPPDPLHDGVFDEDCPLLSVRQDTGEDAYTRLETYDRSDEGAVIYTLRAANTEVMQRITWRPTSPGREVERTYFDDGLATLSSRWQLDAEDRVVAYEAENDGETTDSRRVTYEHDGRVREYEWRGENRGGTARWIYGSDGTLQAVEGTVEERPFRYGYLFDEDGRLTEVTRDLDGARVSTQTWTWRGDLVAVYELEIDSSGRRSGAELDSYKLPRLDLVWNLGEPWVIGPPDYQNTELWPGARQTTRDNGCVLPPWSAGYGYPSAEGLSYALGVPLDERPSGIGFAYAANTFAHQYGDYSWYGHDGVHAMWPIEVLPGFAKVWRFRVEYNAQGEALREEVVIEGTETDAGGALQTTRIERDFDRDNGLVRDALEITLPDGTVVLRALEFLRDEQGRLLARTLTQGRQVLGRQTWSWEGARMSEHTIRIHDPTWSLEGVEAAHPSLEPRPMAAYRWQYDDQDRLVRYEQAGLDDAPPLRPLVETTERDGDTVVITREQGSSTSVTTETYDDGVLVSRREDYDADGDTDRSQTWEYEEGRLVRVESLAPSGPQLYTTQVWSCLAD